MPFNHSLKTARVTADYVVSILDDLVLVDTSAGAVAITLPSFGASTALNYVKHNFRLVKTTSDANAVTITVSGGALINGAASYLLSSQWAGEEFKCDDQGAYQTETGVEFSGSTPGVATASRALILDASKGIATITSATITTLTAPNFAGPEAHAGVITPTGGIAAAAGFTASPRGMWIGQTAPQVSADFNDSIPVITETYVSEIFVPCNLTITGIALFNGTNVTGNVTVGLATSAGAPIAAALSASTAGSGVDAIQRIPFAVAYAAKGPATYFVQVQYSSGTARYNTHILGNHGVLVQTAQTYGVLTSFTAPSTFVTVVGSVGGLY